MQPPSSAKEHMGVESFAGIPFASPPTGNLRLRPPQRIRNNIGVVDGTGIAGACPQQAFRPEDLTIQKIGFSAANNPTDLVRFGISQRKPFIFVAVNYRVSGFGFLGGKEVGAEGSANLGLLDQRIGLEWVADNIAEFDGDPDRVII
ncbi:hypothetical protein TWF506_003782 [Arthrobotrys conoides]|uniref:Carboxylesterase type B domain-containing protein n=1 Tax=Arthrobotrys conoides TaxID=74498 RepID=A0AAN8MY12_9PEZI